MGDDYFGKIKFCRKTITNHVFFISGGAVLGRANLNSNNPPRWPHYVGVDKVPEEFLAAFIFF